MHLDLLHSCSYTVESCDHPAEVVADDASGSKVKLAESVLYCFAGTRDLQVAALCALVLCCGLLRVCMDLGRRLALPLDKKSTSGWGLFSGLEA